MFARVLATGEAAASHKELLPLDADGQREDRWFDFSFNPIAGDSGRVEGVLNIAVESTTRVRAEADLRALASRNGEILESISDAFYAVDRDWRFTQHVGAADQGDRRARGRLACGRSRSQPARDGHP